MRLLSYGLALWLVFCGWVMARDYSQVFAKVEPAVVTILTKGTATTVTAQGLLTNTAAGLGSGVIVSADGLIMTAAHVVDTADEIKILTLDGTLHDARVVSSSVLTDLALVRLSRPPGNLTYIEPWDSDKVAIGDEVFVVGAPHGLSHTLTVGHLSARRLTTGEGALVDTEFLQTDAAVNRGNSGGPLFTAKGRLIGIVSHISSQSGGSEGLGFAASINMARRVLLEESPLWFGIEVVPLRKPLITALNAPYLEGLLVQRVAKGSLGDALDLRGGSIGVIINNKPLLIGGDIIVEVGGDTVFMNRKGRQRTVDYLDSVASGDKIEVLVIRDGKKVLLKATKP